MLENLRRNHIIVNPIDHSNSLVYSFRNGRFFVVPNFVVFEKNESRQRKEIRISDNVYENLLENSCKRTDFDYESIKTPIVLSLMVSNRCNIRCKYCIAFNGKGYSKECNILSNRDVLIDNIRDSHVISLLISGGEPVMNPDLPFFVQDIMNIPMLILLDSNGTIRNKKLTDLLVNRKVILRVSIDSCKREIHDKNRAMFDRLQKNVSEYLSSSVDLRINTVLHRDNYDSMLQLGEWIVDRGIHYWHIFKLQRNFAPKRLWISDKEADDMLMFLKGKFQGRLNVLCKFVKSNDDFSSFVIDSEGYCFSSKKGDKYILGNLLDDSLEEVWRRSPIDYRRSHCDKYLFNEGSK